MLVPMPTVASDQPPAYRPDALETLELSPLQRAIMAADGTLSTLIEAYSGDTLTIRKLRRRPFGGADAASLELAAGEEALRRAVVISGVRLGPVLQADSAIAVSRLEDSVRETLLRTQTPIGKLLLSRRTETFREILSIRLERAGEHGTLLGVAASGPLLVRSYRIFHRGRPLIAITERFRYERFLEPFERGPAGAGSGTGAAAPATRRPRRR